MEEGLVVFQDWLIQLSSNGLVLLGIGILGAIFVFKAIPDGAFKNALVGNNGAGTVLTIIAAIALMLWIFPLLSFSALCVIFALLILLLGYLAFRKK